MTDRLQDALEDCRAAIKAEWWPAVTFNRIVEDITPVIKELCDEIDLVVGFWKVAQDEAVRLMKERDALREKETS